MTPKYGILTLAISVALAGCASDNVAMRPADQSPDTTGMIAPDNPQVAANDKTRALGHISTADYKFIRDAEAAGQFEVSACQKSLTKSSDENVKSLAQHLIDDHTKIGGELTSLATRKGLSDIAGMSPAQIDMLARLDNLSGTDLDREYLTQQQTAHQDTISRFESASTSADDTDLRRWTAATLPALRNHLSMVQTQMRALPATAGNHAATPPVNNPDNGGNLENNGTNTPNRTPGMGQ